jgi:hypothetical protein
MRTRRKGIAVTFLAPLAFGISGVAHAARCPSCFPATGPTGPQGPAGQNGLNGPTGATGPLGAGITILSGGSGADPSNSRLPMPA